MHTPPNERLFMLLFLMIILKIILCKCNVFTITLFDNIMLYACIITTIILIINKKLFTYETILQLIGPSRGFKKISTHMKNTILDAEFTTTIQHKLKTISMNDFNCIAKITLQQNELDCDLKNNYRIDLNSQTITNNSNLIRKK